MSAETLKYFDKLSNENIINWMIQNLSENQIRTCLNKEGSTDISKISSGSGARDLDDAASNVQRIYRGRLARTKMNTTQTDSKEILEELYTKCDGMGYVIADVQNGIVTYYHFKEFDSDIDIQAGINRDTEDGTATWTYKTVPLDVFLDTQCESDERDVFQSLTEDPDNNNNFSPVPDDIYIAAQSYRNLGFDPPVDVYNIGGTSSQDQEDSEPEPQYIMSDIMMKAINTQKKSGEFMKKEFGDDSDYMKMWPVFFVGVEDDNKLSYLFPEVSSGDIRFSMSRVNPRLLNTECKKLTKKIVSDIRNQNITDVMNKLNSALRDQGDDIICRIKFNYDEQNHYSSFGDTNFGEDSDTSSMRDENESNFGEEPVDFRCGDSDIQSNFGDSDIQSNFGDSDIQSNFGDSDIQTNFGVKKRGSAGKTSRDPFNMSEMYNGLDDSDEDSVEMDDDRVPRPMIAGIKSGISKPKRVSDMTIPEIEERMFKMHGAKYASEFKPEKYKTKSGGNSVRYVKRVKCVSTSDCTCTPNSMNTSFSKYGDCPACVISNYGDTPHDTTPLFPEFNTEFGENDDLLF